jgi:hypothetical protein
LNHACEVRNKYFAGNNTRATIQEQQYKSNNTRATIGYIPSSGFFSFFLASSLGMVAALNLVYVI